MKNKYSESGVSAQIHFSDMNNFAKALDAANDSIYINQKVNKLILWCFNKTLRVGKIGYLSKKIE